MKWYGRENGSLLPTLEVRDGLEPAYDGITLWSEEPYEPYQLARLDAVNAVRKLFPERVVYVPWSGIPRPRSGRRRHQG
jgi:hypothetical protein